jgi:type VI protein secretion system component VasK
MSTVFTHVPHPRIAERKLRGPVKVHDQAKGFQPGATRMQRINSRVGLFITVVVGTMWCAYIFAILAFVSLPSTVKQHSATVLVLWISSEFLQLVLLPIIIVGQNIQARAADKRAEDTYKDADAVLHEAEQIQKHLQAQDAAISQILAEVGKTK